MLSCKRKYRSHRLYRFAARQNIALASAERSHLSSNVFLLVEQAKTVIDIMSNISLLPEEKVESLNIKDYKIIQSDKLYKFTSDSVILSRFARGGAERVCDLCSGSGIVSLHYYALNDDSVKSCTCCELQRELARMNEKSVALNGLEKVFTVINAPLQSFVPSEKFDLVLCNPPYEKAGGGILPKNAHLAACRTEATVTLEEIISCASRVLKRGASLCICHKVTRLQELVTLCDKYSLNICRMQFVSGAGGKAYLVLVEALKDKKSDLEVNNAIINDFRDFSGEKK